MSGLLGHLEDAAVQLHSKAQGVAYAAHMDKAGAAVDSATDKARVFAEEHGIPIKYVDISIQFIGADGIPPMDITGSADPYFHADVDGRKTFVSSVQVQTQKPVWNETWRLRNVPTYATLTVRVLDKDDGLPTDDYIGKFDTSITAGAKELDIQGPVFKRSRGKFWLKIDSKSSTDAEPSKHPYMFDGPIRFSRHFSPLVGQLTEINDERLYSTWKLTLRCVPSFFEDKTQHWNTKYAAARKIFADPGSIAVRSAIQAGHRLLYARSTRNGFGVINDARDTLKLLHAGSVPGGGPVTGAANRPAFVHRVKPAVYTYVISVDDDTFRFSETGAKFFVDFASKHALHSNCTETVRYSGEFHPRPKGGWAAFSDETADHQTEWELIIDNNSGTYAPDKALLPTLKALLEYNFPGFVIVALDREDPALTESREACRAYAVKHRGILQQDLQPSVNSQEKPLSHQAAASVGTQEPHDTPVL